MSPRPFGPRGLECPKSVPRAGIAILALSFPGSFAAYSKSLETKIPERKKHININKFAGLSRDWVGGNFFFSFFMGEKKTT